jgi:hypothetical protein
VAKFTAEQEKLFKRLALSDDLYDSFLQFPDIPVPSSVRQRFDSIVWQSDPQLDFVAPSLPFEVRMVRDATHPYAGTDVYPKVYDTRSKSYTSSVTQKKTRFTWFKASRSSRDTVPVWVPGFAGEPDLYRGLGAQRTLLSNDHKRLYIGYETSSAERDRALDNQRIVYPIYVNWYDFLRDGVPNYPGNQSDTRQDGWDKLLLRETHLIYRAHENKVDWSWEFTRGEYYRNRKYRSWCLKDEGVDYWVRLVTDRGGTRRRRVYLLYQIYPEYPIFVHVMSAPIKDSEPAKTPPVVGNPANFDTSYIGDDAATQDLIAFTGRTANHMVNDPVVFMRLVGGAESDVHYNYADLVRAHALGVEFLPF